MVLQDSKIFKAAYQIGHLNIIWLSSNSTICLLPWTASLSAEAPSQAMPAIAPLKLMNLHLGWTQPHPFYLVCIPCCVWFVLCEA